LITPEDEEIYCNRYCTGGGKVVPGTGMCECLSINDPAEICDAKCLATKPIPKITADGML